jgi:hypothetical protein
MKRATTAPAPCRLDPIVIREWQEMAYHEIEETAQRGVIGVWNPWLLGRLGELPAVDRQRPQFDWGASMKRSATAAGDA